MGKHKVYVSYVDDSSGGGLCDGEEGRFGTREDVHTHFELREVSRTQGSWCETVHVDFDPAEVDEVFVVVVRYTTGSTFGTTYGAWHIEGVYRTFEEANSVAKSIDDDTYDKCQYPAWKGYFESLEEVSVEPRNLNQSEKSVRYKR